MNEEQPKKRILPLRKTKDNWWVLSVGWEVVPGYPYAKLKKELPEDQFRTEVLRDWSASRGRKVYSQYRDELHLAREPLDVDPTGTIFCGWDFAWGGASVPAFVPTQINGAGQWQIWPALAPLENTSVGIYEFCSEVADYLYREFALPYGKELRDLKLVHIGDPSGRNRMPRPGEKKNEAASWYDVMRRGLDVCIGYDDHDDPVIEHKPGWGWICTPGAVNISTRLEAVRSRLSLILPGGWPGLVLDPRAESIRTAFLGEYHFEEYSDGTYSDKPEKNRASDIMDALAYAATRMFSQPQMSQDDEEDEDRPRHEWVSHAANRRY